MALYEGRYDRFFYRLSLTLFLLLLFVVVFGSYLMPHYVDHSHRLLSDVRLVDGVEKRVSAPFPPDDEFWLGTDHRGYDVLSLLLNGAKYTFGFALLVTGLRFLIAMPLGLYAGVTGRGRSLLTSLQLVTTSVPALLFIFPMMYGLSQVLPTAERDKMLFVMLVVFGIFQVAHQFADRAAFYRDKEFVTAAKMMGASNGRIVFTHLVPHLRPELLFAFLTELVQVLFLFGQLAVVYVFIGGGERFMLVDPAPGSRGEWVNLTTSGEWGGMIAYGITVLRVYPWIVMSAGAFFTAAVLILTFFSNQLQKRLTRPYLYPSRPLVENRPRLLLIGAVAAGCLLMVIQLPDKSPPPRPADAVSTLSANGARR